MIEWNCPCGNSYKFHGFTQPEPVAWIDASSFAMMNQDPRFNRVQWQTTLTLSQVYEGQIPLYATPPQPKEQEPVVTDAMVEAAVKAFWGYENSKVCRTAYRLAIKAALQEKFCDNNCVWTDHHPDCKLAQPDRQELQAKGEHPAPCARFCEANAFQIEIRNLKAKLENQHPEWYHTKNTHGCDVFYHKTEERSYMFGEITPLYTTPPQHKEPEKEPVALQMDVIVVNLVREGINKHRARELAEHFIKHTTPPQRTWVGLTEEEVIDLWPDLIMHRHTYQFWQNLEAKLKELNK